MSQANSVIFPIKLIPQQFKTYDYLREQKLSGLKLYKVKTKSNTIINLSVICFVEEPICTVLYSHGNLETLTALYAYNSIIKKLKARFVFYDYDGYGESTGACSEQAIIDDIASVFSFITTDQSYLKNNLYSSENIFAWGKNIGSVPTIWLGQNIDLFEKGDSLKGIILQCPIASYKKTMFQNEAPIENDILLNYERIRSIKHPVLIMHGLSDEVVPYINTEILIRNLPDKYIKLTYKQYKNEYSDEENILRNKDKLYVIVSLMKGVKHNTVESWSEFNEIIYSFIKHCVM